jgi:hypothetical protein
MAPSPAEVGLARLQQYISGRNRKHPISAARGGSAERASASGGRGGGCGHNEAVHQDEERTPPDSPSLRAGEPPSPRYAALRGGGISRPARFPFRSSRHPAHFPPALEGGPDAALKSEAVDGRGGMQRADAAEADAGPLEATFFQDAARRRVGDAGAGVE